MILLTQDSGKILGPISKLLGVLMNGIFLLLDAIGIPNTGLSIILFTFVIYLLMTPLTIKQQKFSKLQSKMNPEIQAIQAKYKNKKDNDSMMAMNMETKAVYAKYGVSPSGSCVQLIIQMPILFALYRVIYAMPAYVGKIKEAFFPLVDKLIAQTGSVEFIQTFKDAAFFNKQFNNEQFTSGVTTYVQNTFVDVLNRASTTEFMSIAEKYPSLANDVTESMEKLNQYNYFLGLNIGNSPSFTIKQAFSSGSYLLIVGALMIPVLAALTQWLNVKLMPQPEQNNKNEDDKTAAMAQSMKTMNMMMPLMSAWFCFTLPAGMGIYWIAGAVVRSIQQVVINKHIDKMDIDDVIKKNESKAKAKMEKANVNAEKMKQYSNMNTKAVTTNTKSTTSKSAEEREEALKKATEYYSKGAKPGSLASKANMVKQYNEKNNK